ncbi:hypothetical protein KKC65_02195 [Patescibacteria group bacterium]|nr:hypothetical protein [Patescibacteria group bacterium]
MFKKIQKTKFILSVLLFSLIIVLFPEVVLGALVGGSLNVSQINPNMVFTFQAQAAITCSAFIEIDDNADFSSLVYSAPEGWDYSGAIKTHNVSIDSLPENTTLYWRIRETNCWMLTLVVLSQTYNGPNFIVTPLIVAPTVVTNSVINIEETSVTLNGDITDTGGENASERGFEWGTVSGSYPNDWTEVGSYGTGAFNRGITGLTSSTTYYFRAKARNSAGWSYGEELSFITVTSPPPPPSSPCEDHELWGFAWSENIGWISFSCRDTMNLGEGVDYGVDIDETNDLLEGYAWSENIGWINFDQTIIDISGETGNLSGWARAVAPIGKPLSETGGWDGWISLDGNEYQVTLNSGSDPSEFENYAWGGDVVGWISFNSENTDSVVDYSVKTNFSFTPTATDLNTTDANYCFTTSPPIFLNWTFSDPDPGDVQISYQIEVDNNNDFSSPEIADSGGSSQTYAPFGLSFGDTYWWRVDVSDGVVSSGWINGPSFTTDPRWPEPSFTWVQDPTSFDIAFDGSVNYCASCGYSWDFGDGVGTSSSEDPIYSYLAEDSYRVIFTATSNGRSCNDSEVINVGEALPLPTWEETVPF